MRKFISVLLVIAMVLGVVPVPFFGEIEEASAFAGGSGTAADPYVITSAVHLINIGNNLSAHYRLEADIDLNGIDWIPIGSFNNRFSGVLDGNGHVIRNLKVKPDGSYAGLFVFLEGARIKNLGFENVEVTLQDQGVDSKWAGTLAAYASDVIISEVYVRGGTVKGSIVGGLVGTLKDNFEIRNCFVTDLRVEKLSSYHSGGGLVGNCQTDGSGCLIKNSYVARTEFNYTTKYSGGIIGYSPSAVTLENVYFDKTTAGLDVVAWFSSSASTTQGAVPLDFMKYKDLYLNWDFVNIWKILDGETLPWLDPTYPIYNVTVSVEPFMAGVVIGSGAYEVGSRVTVEALPSEGYVFNRWLENGIELSTENPYSFIIEKDVDLIADFFSLLPVVQSLECNPSSLDLPKGKTGRLTIIANMSDGTQQDVTGSASYSSSNPSVATISNGVVTAVSQGTATITASYEGKNVSIPVTVTAPVPKTDSTGNYIVRNFQYSPNPVNLQVGQSVTVTVTKLEIQMTDDSWQDISGQVTLSAPAQGYITVNGNTVTGQSAGSTTISVLYNGKVVGTIPVTVTQNVPVPVTDENGNYIYQVTTNPTEITLAKGQSKTITLISVKRLLSDGSWEDVTSQATLQSADSGIASLTGNTVKGMAEGQTSILVKYAGQTAGSIPVTITAPVPETDANGNYILGPSTSITPNSISVPVGVSAAINVNKVEIKLTDGSNQDVTNQVTLQVTNPSIATLSGNTVTGAAVGNTSVVATYNGKTIKTILVTVTAPVPVTDGSGNYIIDLNYSPASISIYEGETETIIIHTAAIQLTDGSWQDISGSITMQVGNSTIAGLSGNVVTGKKAGSTTITLRYNGKALASIPVEVQAVPVVTTGITVTPAQVNVKQNQTQQLTVKATLSSGTTKTVTAQASYSSHDTEIATVTASGQVKGIAAGSTIITVSYDGYTVDVPVTVTENSAGSPNVSTKDRTGGGSSSAPVVNTPDRGTGSGGSGSSTPPVNSKDRGSSSGTGGSAPVVSRPDNRGNEDINQKERPENGGTPVVNKKTR